MGPQPALELNQQYVQGCGFGQQAMAYEASGNVAAAAQLYEQSAATIGSSILMAQQAGVPITDQVFFVCACAHFHAARLRSISCWTPAITNHLLQAQGAIGQAIAVNPGFFQYHSAAGMIEIAMSNAVGALAAFQRALQLNPVDAWSQYMLGILYAAQGNAATGNHYYHAAARTVPDLPPPQQLISQFANPRFGSGRGGGPARMDWNQFFQTIGEVAKCVNTIGGLFDAPHPPVTSGS